MRAEVSFWQAMFCLSFWDEIFEGMGPPLKGRDIPLDLFKGEDFYLNRKEAIDNRYEQIKSSNLPDFINQQIKIPEGAWTRLIFNGNEDMLAYARSDIVQGFAEKLILELLPKLSIGLPKTRVKTALVYQTMSSGMMKSLGSCGF